MQLFLPQHGWVLLTACLQLWWVKTKETFKLSDVQLFHSQIVGQEIAEPVVVERLILDAATGSNLLQIETTNDAHLVTSMVSLLPYCDWMGRVVARGSSPEDLLRVVRQTNFAAVTTTRPWTLNFARLVSSTQCPSKIASRTNLACAIAQAVFPAPAALNPSDTDNCLFVVETDAELALVKKERVATKANILPKDLWSQRPFAYSSAMNFDAATLMVDMLMLQQPGQERGILLDVTCGSGTFLAMGLWHGFSVIGIDTNEKCLMGCRQNLQHVHRSIRAEKAASWRLIHGSCTNMDAIDETISCVVSNLPWGINTPTEDTMKLVEELIRGVRRLVDKNIPCAFASKADPVMARCEWWKSHGFEMRGSASIPPRSFSAPHPRKQSKKRAIEPAVNNGRSECAIFIVKST